MHSLRLIISLCALLVFSGATPDEVSSTSEIVISTLTFPDGRRVTIYQKELERAIEASPHQTVEATLQQLIEVTLLAHQAEQRGFTEHPSALHARDLAAVRRLIVSDFENKHRIETLPDRYVQAAKASNIKHFRHPELRRAVHLLLKPLDSQSQAMTMAQAIDLAGVVEQVRVDLDRDPISSREGLSQRLERFRQWMPEGYEVIYESLGRFAREGRFHRDFTEACFEAKQLPGLIGPVQTPFGFHFIWLEEIIPALDTPEEEIDAEVKRRILPEVRTYEWRQLLTQLLQEAERGAP